MKIERYMHVENPTAVFAGKRKSYQGFAVHGDIGFVSFHTGICAAYDLAAKYPTPIGVFRFGSYHDGETDEDGYIGRCTVERITRRGGIFASECVQTIIYNNDGIDATPWETPGWGWFAHFADTDGGFYYTLSARYRTTAAFLDKYDENAYIVTKFRLPEIREKGGTVILRPTDIINQMHFPFDVLFTQGGRLYTIEL